MKIGILSDTHDYLDPLIPALFAGVDHILHCGDIGASWLITELETIAPVTAVRGNCDDLMHLNEMETIVLNGLKIMVMHIFDVYYPLETAKLRIAQEQASVVVFGHTHRRYCERRDQVLFFNPGYAGKPRNKCDRSVGILNCGNQGITAAFEALPMAFPLA